MVTFEDKQYQKSESNGEKEGARKEANIIIIIITI
jgi:hypothetical protein